MSTPTPTFANKDLDALRKRLIDAHGEQGEYLFDVAAVATIIISIGAEARLPPTLIARSVHQACVTFNKAKPVSEREVMNVSAEMLGHDVSDLNERVDRFLDLRKAGVPDALLRAMFDSPN